MGHRLNVCMLPFPLRRGNVIACKYTYFTLNGNCRRPFFYASAVKDGANGRECGLPPIPRRSRPTAKVAAIAPARPCQGGVARSPPAKKRLRQRRPNILSAKSLPFAFKFITLPPTRQARWENNLKRQPYVTQQERHDALPRPRPLLQPWLAAQVLHRRPRGGVLAHPARQHRLGHGISRRQVLDDIKFMESSEGWGIPPERWHGLAARSCRGTGGTSRPTPTRPATPLGGR